MGKWVKIIDVLVGVVFVCFLCIVPHKLISSSISRAAVLIRGVVLEERAYGTEREREILGRHVKSLEILLILAKRLFSSFFPLSFFFSFSFIIFI